MIPSKDYVVIRATSKFTQVYVVPLDDADNDVDKARTMVQEEQVKEFSQTYLGQNIFDVDVVNEEQLLALFSTDNPHLSSWSDEKKLNFVNKYKQTRGIK